MGLLYWRETEAQSLYGFPTVVWRARGHLGFTVPNSDLEFCCFPQLFSGVWQTRGINDKSSQESGSLWFTKLLLIQYLICSSHPLGIIALILQIKTPNLKESKAVVIPLWVIELEFKMTLSDSQVHSSFQEATWIRKQLKSWTSKRKKSGCGKGGECSLYGTRGLQVKHNKIFWAAKIVHYSCEFPEEISLSAGEWARFFPEVDDGRNDL